MGQAVNSGASCCPTYDRDDLARADSALAELIPG